MGALDGIRIIDMTQAMSGPFATMLLGDLGAEIIKVEPPEGDQTRSWAPPYMNGLSSYFMSTNRNKKSISIDLKTPPRKGNPQETYRKFRCAGGKLQTGCNGKAGILKGRGKKTQ